MSGRFIKNNSRCHQNVMFTTVKMYFVEAVFPSFCLVSNSGEDKTGQDSDQETFENGKVKSMIRREGLGARARAAVFVFCEGLVYFMGAAILAGSSGHVIFA